MKTKISPQSLIGSGIQVDAIAGHLLAEGQDQGYKIHWAHKERRCLDTYRHLKNNVFSVFYEILWKTSKKIKNDQVQHA